MLPIQQHLATWLIVHLNSMQGRHLQVERPKETAGRKSAIDVDIHAAGGHNVRVDSWERAREAIQ